MLMCDFTSIAPICSVNAEDFTGFSDHELLPYKSEVLREDAAYLAVQEGIDGGWFDAGSQQTDALPNSWLHFYIETSFKTFTDNLLLSFPHSGHVYI